MITLLDNFVDADGTALADHDPDIGGPWTDNTPGWEIQSNVAIGTADPSVSSAPLTGRAMRGSILWNKNGMAAGSIINFFLAPSVGGSPHVSFRFTPGELGASLVNADTSQAALVYLKHPALIGDKRFRFVLSASRLWVAWADKEATLIPRSLPVATLLDTFVMEANIDGGAYPIVKQILIER